MYVGSFSCFLYQSLNFCVPEPSPTWFPCHFPFFYLNSMNTSAIFISENFDFYLQTPCTQVHFLASSIKA
ncbi:hypothetical protein JHK82_033714 [Glycine max]|nr:hypothetical protein JHK85_034433 [Glycine max]KAG5119294.1 hypothetical protein JHK82_033714 [Glycine max]KAG5140287.1 hypothetical protein JHK84_034055 [Glycine max]